jgi:tryptophan synthase beta chain
VAAFHELALLEGIIPALESSHALAEARKRAVEVGKGGVVVVCLSGRGDKDLESVLEYDGGLRGNSEFRSQNPE